MKRTSASSADKPTPSKKATKFCLCRRLRAEQSSRLRGFERYGLIASVVKLGRIIFVMLADSPTGETPMHRFPLLLFVIVITTQSWAQSIFDRSETMDLVTVTKYCANVKDYSDSHVPRIFAQ